MRAANKKALAILLVVLPLLFIFIYHWGSESITTIDIQGSDSFKELLEKRIQQPKYKNDNIPYHVKDSISKTLSINGCVCESDKPRINLPFAQLLFPQVSATQLHALLQDSDLQRAKQYRDKEYHSFRKRTYTAADSLILAEANSPLQYPTQGVEVRPTRTILIPACLKQKLWLSEVDCGFQELNLKGLSLKKAATRLELLFSCALRSYDTVTLYKKNLSAKDYTGVVGGLSLNEISKESPYLVDLIATMGTFDTTALVNGVQIIGEGEMHITFVSESLALLNRQLQFVTYTNTQFHPNTADVVQFKTTGFQATFTIRIRHPPMPRFFNPAPKKDYNVNTLVTIATKTFLRYDKLQDLIDSIRQFYPTITIVIADDTKDPKPVKGPYIEHYLMPFGKGWFAGRNLAVSQVTTKYVLWVDDDFIFTSNTKLEKMVDILETTTLDLVGGAVREVTGYTTTYRHIITTDSGDEEGDCLHIRTGFHHVIEGFPNCVVTDAVINFFMARTEKIRQVGFDPRLARVGHLAFYIDGLGSLHVGSCDDVIINHASKIKGMLPWGQSDTDKAYASFRYPSSGEQDVNEYDLYYLKNHFKCVTSD